MNAAIPPPLSARLTRLVPLLRRYARALAGSQAQGDARVATLLARLVADPRKAAEDLASADDDRVGLYRALDLVASPDDAAGDAVGPHERAAAERLRALSGPEQKALLLTALEGFTMAQTARILGTTEAEARRLADSARATLRRLGGGRVVIIEDEPIIAADLECIVGELGHVVVGRSATREGGVAVALTRRPDLVLADIRLADGSSGIEAVRDILANLDVPAIFITGYPERLLTGVRPEPTFLVAKPFSAAAVQTAVARALFFRSSAPIA